MSIGRLFRLKLLYLMSYKALVVLTVLSVLLILYGHQNYSGQHNVPQGAYNMAYVKEKGPLQRPIYTNKLNTVSTNVVSKEIEGCVHRTLDIKDPVMMRFYKKMPKVVCKGEKNWIFVHNGTIRFSEEAKKRHGNFSCDYYALIRGPGDYNHSFDEPIRNIKDGASLVSDFFKAECKDANGVRYVNHQAGIHLNQTIRERFKTSKPPANGLGLSIALLGFDSMSRMSWLRRMPSSRDYLVKQLQAIELEGYNIMGDGTPAALLPILTGKHEQELPEARRNFKRAKTVDDFPWLWRNFSQHGYVTSWADAEIAIAPFNYRLLGFEHPPTDYFMRPFFLAVDPTYRNYSHNCHGSEPRHIVWLNWIRDIFYMYKNDPKFLIHFYTPLSHDDNNKMTMADDDLKRFIEHLETGGFLNNTLLIIMADHGARFANVRGTLSGKLEERLPYISLRFPPWFEHKYPHLIRNLKTNVHRLSTPLDLHETLKDFLRLDGAGLGDLRKRGISLFKEIPKSRTCAHADVAPHWCACMAWQNVDRFDKGAQKALQTAISTINNFTQEYRTDCALLSIGEVTLITKMTTSNHVLMFKETTGDRGLRPIMSDKRVKNDKAIYQLTFFTKPGRGQFEVTLEHSLLHNTMTVSPKAISRINKYGDEPACILDRNREIRQYCYCKNNIKWV